MPAGPLHSTDTADVLMRGQSKAVLSPANMLTVGRTEAQRGRRKNDGTNNRGVLDGLRLQAPGGGSGLLQPSTQAVSNCCPVQQFALPTDTTSIKAKSYNKVSVPVNNCWMPNG